MPETGILILEKNRLEFLLLKERLVELGFAQEHLVHCTALADLEKPAMAGQVPGFIFLDLFLPDSAGINTFLIIHRLYPSVPIVVLSDLKEKEAALQCIHLGAQDYLVKGEFSNQLLTKTIRFATERNAYRREMAKRSSQIEGILESIGESFFMLDREWRVQYWNHAAIAMYGIPAGKAIGRIIWDLFPQGKEVIKDVYERALNRQKTEHFEYFSPATNRWMSISVYPMDDRGMTVFIKDLSEEKRRTLEAIETRNNYQALINFTADDIWSIDRNLRLIAANQSFQDRMLRLNGVYMAKGDYVLSDRMPAADYEKWKSRYETALGGEAVVMEEAVRFHNGEFALMEFQFNPIRNDQGDVTGVACHSHQMRGEA